MGYRLSETELAVLFHPWHEHPEEPTPVRRVLRTSPVVPPAADRSKRKGLRLLQTL